MLKSKLKNNFIVIATYVEPVSFNSKKEVNDFYIKLKNQNPEVNFILKQI